jgi:PKHD-type hydroxylase
MLLHVPHVLDSVALARVRDILHGASWSDGRITAGTQSAQVKNNLQLREDSVEAEAARAIVLERASRNALFFSAALPRRIFPPLFNRYDGAANEFGSHVDNAVRRIPGTGDSLRTDLSATLFLADADSYDGGELVVEDNFGTHSVKLPAGDLVLYPASSLHRVAPVTRGARVASFFWIESMVRDDARRQLLFDLDVSIVSLRDKHGDTVEAVRLTACYHNLLRMWAVA